MTKTSRAFAALLCGAILPACADLETEPDEEPRGGAAQAAAPREPLDLELLPEELLPAEPREPDHSDWVVVQAEDRDPQADAPARDDGTAGAPTTWAGPSCLASALSFTVFPLAGTNGRDWMINNYTDRDTTTGLRDFMGQTGTLARTYDGHNGADIDIASFRGMDSGAAVVRAAAPGIVRVVVEDQEDRHTTCTGQWNVVEIEHANGYRVFYGHLRRDSVVVTVGQTVTAGQTLGVAGSSGCSSHPHLHLEVHDCSGSVVEAFNGMWPAPPAYAAPSDVMDVMLRKGAFANVDQVKDPVANPTLFAQNETLGLALSAALRGGDVVTISMVAPDGSVPSSWSWTVPGVARYAHWFPSWTWIVPATSGSWTARILINNSLRTTRTFNVSTQPAGMGEIARNGVPAAQYQQVFTDIVSAGYRPVWIDGFDVGGTAYLNATFRPAGGVAWIARHGLTAAQYQTEVTTWSGQGYRLTHVDSYLSAGAVRYAAIFTQEPGAAWTAYHGVSEATHVAKVTELIGQGFRPVNVSLVSVNGARQVTALWDKAPFGGWWALHKVAASSYQAEVDAQLAAGRLPHYVNTYRHDGVVFYSAIFSSASLGSAWAARHGQTPAQYQTTWTSFSAQGFATRAVTGVDAGGVAAYAAIWSK